MWLILSVGFLIIAALAFRFAVWPALRKPSLDGGLQSLPKATDRVEVIDRSEGRQVYACGHEDADRFDLELYGERQRFNDAYFKDKPYCGDCLLKFVMEGSIRCAACGLIIRDDDPVALYSSGDGLGRYPSTLVDGQYVGCMRWDCCPSGGFFSGHWTSQGFKPLFASGNSVVGEVFATGEPVFIQSGPKDRES